MSKKKHKQHGTLNSKKNRTHWALVKHASMAPVQGPVRWEDLSWREREAFQKLWHQEAVASGLLLAPIGPRYEPEPVTPTPWQRRGTNAMRAMLLGLALCVGFPDTGGRR